MQTKVVAEHALQPLSQQGSISHFKQISPGEHSPFEAHSVLGKHPSNGNAGSLQPGTSQRQETSLAQATGLACTRHGSGGRQVPVGTLQTSLDWHVAVIGVQPGGVG